MFGSGTLFASLYLKEALIMKKALQWFMVANALLIVATGCERSPDKSTMGKRQCSNKISVMRIENETQQVAKILQRTKEKLSNVLSKNIDVPIDTTTYRKIKTNNHTICENKKFRTNQSSIYLQKEVLKSVQNDPLFKAIIVLESMNINKNKN